MPHVVQNKDIIAIFVLFSLSFYLYTLPVKTSLYPFGEGDAVHKFGLANWIYESDRIDNEVPFFYAVWYPWVHKDDFYRPPNPIPYQVNIASSRLLTPGDRFLGTDLFFAITAAPLSCLALYFVFRRLYNFWVGFLSSLLLMMSLLLIMPYLWGQRPHLISITFCFVIIYCFYKYTESYLKKEEKPIYLYIAALLFAGTVNQLQMLSWLGAFWLSYSLYLLIKHKKLPFNWKHGITCAIIVVIIVMPFIRDTAIDYVIKPFAITQLDHLFSWFKTDSTWSNQFMYQYDKTNWGYWTLPFLLIGLAVLLFRREERDVLTIFLLLSLYITLHLYILNFIDQSRATRVFYATAFIFYPIIVLGMLGIYSIIPQLKKIKIFILGGFIIAIVFFNLVPAYTTLKESYPPITRMTNEQLEFALWAKQNIPDDSLVYTAGALSYPKMRWINMISEKPMVGFSASKYDSVAQDIKAYPAHNRVEYILLDYSDYYIVGLANEISAMKQFETAYTKNATLIYDKNEIRVFKLEN